MQNQIQFKDYKCLYILSALYFMAIINSSVFANRLILTPLGILSGASIFSPVWLMLGDMIAEVYGYKMARHLFWIALFSELIFCLISQGMLYLPIPESWHGSDTYQLMTDHLVRFALLDLLAITIAWRINIHLLIKWKILLKGRYFWLRSLGSSGIGSIIYTLIGVTLCVVGVYPLHEVISIVAWAIATKMIGLIILSPIGQLIVVYLKRIEGPLENNYLASFNPFKKAG